MFLIILKKFKIKYHLIKNYVKNIKLIINTKQIIIKNIKFTKLKVFAILINNKYYIRLLYLLICVMLQKSMIRLN